MTNLQAPPSRVIAGSEATLALPLGELSPKVTEGAWQALTDSPKAFPCSGRVLRDCHALLCKARNDKLGGLLHPEGRRDKPASASLPCHGKARSALGSPSGRAVTEGD